ncbi:MAG: XrtA/PEP-CTERM system TPR-repeat protein PrsT [Burkholderiales bacterium]
MNECLVKIARFLLIASTALYLAGCESSSKELVAKAKESIAQHKTKEAVIQLRSALAKEPNQAETRYLLAQQLVLTGEAAAAEKEARKAMELGMKRSAIHATLARTILLQGDLDRLLTETAVIDTDVSQPDKASILGLRGQAYVVKAQHDDARSALNQALQLDASSTAALVGKGALHGIQREYEEARRWIDRAIKSDNTSPEAWSALGDLELALGKSAQAETAFTTAIKNRLFVTLDIARRALARIQLKQYAEAEADLQTLKQGGYKLHPYVNYLAGLNRFRQGKYQEAADAFELSFNTEPRFLPNRMYLASAHLMLKHPQQAIEHAQYVYANAPQSLAAKRLLGAVQISRAEFAAANEVLRATLEKSPNDAAALRMLATAAMMSGDTTQGLEYARKIAALDPKSQQAQDMVMIARLLNKEKLEDGGVEISNDPNRYTREFLLAVEAFRDGKIGDALKRAEALHKQDPNNADPLNLIAACYLIAGQWEKAKVELEKVLKIRPNEPSATKNLAKVEAAIGKPERARELLQSFVKEQPDDEIALSLLAEIENKLGNAPAALQLLEQAHQRNPGSLNLRALLAAEHLRAGRPAKVLEITHGTTDPEFKSRPALLELRGKAHAQLGEMGAAKSTFERWVEYAPDSAAAHFLLGDVLARGGDAAGARKQLARALKLDPRYLPARIGEVKSLVYEGKMKEAKAAISKLRKDFGDPPGVLGIEGWFALGTRDFATAVKSLSLANQRAPSNEFTMMLATAHWGQKQPDQGIAILQDWLKQHPQDVPVLLRLADGYMGLKKSTEAQSTYESILRIYPNHVPALNNLAWLKRDSDLKSAIALAEQAHRIVPKEWGVMDTLGTLYLKSGDTSKAYDLLKQASQAAPGSPEVQLHFAQALVQLKQPQKAKDVLGQILKKAPESPQAKEAKKILETLGAGNS